ncbi:MAG: hypothetical protein LBC23_05895 [Coriobacteriales bacterium]|nr:hypothetical protein [Coriobacteriales bacterium]
MATMTVGELKTHFSEVLAQVQQGEEYQVAYGRAKKPVARLVPMDAERPSRTVGILQDKASFTLSEDFKFASEEEFLGLI